MPPKHPQHGREPGRRDGDPLRKISHALTWVLRHHALELGLPVTKDGYVPVKLLMQHSHPRLRALQLTLEGIEHVVATNEKQRFKLEGKTVTDFDMGSANATLLPPEPVFLCIRANQGHSIPGIDAHALLQPLTSDELAEIPTIVHGTFHEAWSAIQKSGGLSKMGRNHIHFAHGLLGQDGVISGMRKSCQVFIYINASKCAQDGIKFFRSDNGVLLTAGLEDEGILPMEYISYVTDKKGDLLLDQRFGS